MNCRIDRLLIADDRVLLSFGGWFTAQYVDLLRGLLERERSAVAIDLKDVFHVDREAVNFLARCESNGAELRNCAAYVREWITRERADANASETVIEREGTEKMVAIIEDDESYRVAVQRLLKSAGFSVHSFASAEDFLNSGQQQETGCLITDSRMLGLDLQSKLNSDHCPILTIFVTANGDEKMPLPATRTGVVKFLTKTLDGETLIEAVRVALAVKG